MKKNKGFTLIELLAVIVLLAIVGIVGANLIITRLNKAKADTMINDFMDLQKEIAYKSMNDSICGDETFPKEVTYSAKDGWLSVNDCTKYYDINSDDYMVLLGYGRPVYDKDGNKWTSGDKYKYYINVVDGVEHEVLLNLRYENGKFIGYYDKDDKLVEITKGTWKMKLDENYLLIELVAKKTGKFKSVAFSNEQIEKICKGYLKGQCGTSNTEGRGAVLKVTREF